MNARFAPVLFVLAACQSTYTVDQKTPDVAVSPSILDFGQIATGDTAVDSFQLDIVENRGSSTVTSVAITGPGAAHFALVDPNEAFDVEWDASAVRDVIFAPTEPGWHSATVEITHKHGDAENRHLEVPIRGRALDPEIEIAPWAIDFGPVDVGETGLQQVIVRNLTDLDVTISGAIFSNPYAFSTTQTFPLDLPGGFERTMTIAFAPVDATPITADTMTLTVGATPAATLQLGGNDCANGLPAAYDGDGDGYTMCAGDCDDDDLDVHPGADEVWDGVDQDCDGIADEGTAGYDDDGDGYCEGPGICTVGALGDMDCHDGQPAINPASVEVPNNGIDDDCDGVVDVGTLDQDGDGFTAAGGDCDDTDPNRSPALSESPDAVDNDCDGFVDEGTIWYDDDGDGYCEGPICSDGSAPGDCYDADPATAPYAVELEDWIDNDCDGAIDEGTRHDDSDGDGYSELGGDCDDGDPLNNPSVGYFCP